MRLRLMHWIDFTLLCILVATEIFIFERENWLARLVVVVVVVGGGRGRSSAVCFLVPTLPAPPPGGRSHHSASLGEPATVVEGLAERESASYHCVCFAETSTAVCVHMHARTDVGVRGNGTHMALSLSNRHCLWQVHS